MLLNIRPVPAPTLTNLACAPSVRAIVLTWDKPTDTTYAGAEIWSASVSTIGSAVKIGTVTTNTFTDTTASVNPVSNRYYWVRAINIYGRTDGAWSNMATAKSLLNTNLDIAAGAVQASNLNVAAIDPNTGNLTARSITSTMIQTGAVTANEIAANTITAAQIWSGYVYTNTLNASQITAGQMSADRIDVTNLRVGATNITATLGGDNLMNNSGFEVQTTTDANRPNGYSRYNNGAGSPASYISVAGRTGGKAFAIRATSSGTNGASTFGLYSRSDVVDGTVAGGVQGGWQPNKTYVISFKAKKVNGAGFGAMCFQWNSGPSTTTWVTNPSLTTAWQTYTARITWGNNVPGVNGISGFVGELYLDAINGGLGYSVVANDEIHIDELIVQEGDVYSEWFPSSAEAKATADAANTALAVIADDHKLSVGEKPAVEKEWDAIYNERGSLVTQASSLGVDSSTYVTKFNALQNYLASIPGWGDHNTDSSIDPAAFKNNFTAYYTERTNLVNALTAKAATLSTWSGVTGTGKPADYATVSAADAATALGFNPQFSNWTGTYPVGWSAWSGPAPVKETSNYRTGPYAVKYTVSGETGMYGSVGFPTPLPAGTFVQGSFDINVIANNGGGSPGYLIRLYTDSSFIGFVDNKVTVPNKTVTGWQHVPFIARVGAGQVIWGMTIYQMASWGGMSDGAWADGSVCIFDNLAFDFYDSSTDNKQQQWSDVGGSGKPDNNATAGAPAGTYVGGMEAGLAASYAANGNSAYNAVNDATNGLAQKLKANARNVLSGAAGVVAGTLAWDANGAYSSGYGVAMTAKGIVCYNTSGQATLTVDAGTGNLTLSGTVYANAGAIGGMTLSNGALCSGGFSGYAWPPSGQTGCYFGPSGILLGNGTDNKFFQVDSAGNVYAPGFQLYQGQLTLTNTVLVNPRTSTSFNVTLSNLTVSNITNGSTYTTNPIAPTISNGTAPYSYTWSFTSQTGSNIKMTSGTTGSSATIQASSTNNSTTGNLYVTVTDANGNSKTASATITLNFGSGF